MVGICLYIFQSSYNTFDFQVDNTEYNINKFSIPINNRYLAYRDCVLDS